MAKRDLKSDLDFNHNAGLNFVLDPQAENPAIENSVLGQLYYNTMDKELRHCNGEKWLPVSNSDVKIDATTVVWNDDSKLQANAIIAVTELPTTEIKDGTFYKCNGALYYYKDTVFVKVMETCPFPVGGVYISIGSTDPSTTWPGTTWALLTEGTTLWNTATGGGAVLEAELPALPTITGSTSSAGAHTHTVNGSRTTGYYVPNGSYYGKDETSVQTTSSNGAHTHTVTVKYGTSDVYGASVGNVVRPTSIAVCMWQRTA